MSDRMRSETELPIYGEYGVRTLLRISGPDAASYLHNLCTQDIRALQAGACSEAFVTSVQGKTLGYVRIFRDADSFWLDTSAGQADTLLGHFEKYHIREKVSFENCSAGAEAFVVSWSAVEGLLKSRGVAPPSVQQFVAIPELDGSMIARWEIAGSGMGYGIFASDAGKSQWSAFWGDAKGATISSEEVTARRIAAGSVEFGSDITPENLPQEIARDAKAISFQKGCYLGQETVARIDALGHVNRLLVRLCGEGDLGIRPGMVLKADESPVGHITSAAYWQARNESWALGLVRRGRHAPGNELLADEKRLTVVG